jgi:hypothetical protein
LKIYDKKFKEMWKHTLHPESIAMENPLYIPKVVWPTVGASGAHGSTMSPSDWVILEPSSKPSHIFIPNEEVGDDGSDDILPTHRAHVSSG